mmetsp:Transcript_3358/g.4921  ORF Transcript_3358/g.4921 Transcript_3358/m.4921 type:complete len:81 (+) Transcript_3358:37-279(+)
MFLKVAVSCLWRVYYYFGSLECIFMPWWSSTASLHALRYGGSQKFEKKVSPIPATSTTTGPPSKLNSSPAHTSSSLPFEE